MARSKNSTRNINSGRNGNLKVNKLSSPQSKFKNSRPRKPSRTGADLSNNISGSKTGHASNIASPRELDENIINSSNTREKFGNEQNIQANGVHGFMFTSPKRNFKPSQPLSVNSPENLGPALSLTKKFQEISQEYSDNESNISEPVDIEMQASPRRRSLRSPSKSSKRGDTNSRPSLPTKNSLAARFKDAEESTPKDSSDNGSYVPPGKAAIRSPKKTSKKTENVAGSYDALGSPHDSVKFYSHCSRHEAIISETASHISHGTASKDSKAFFMNAERMKQFDDTNNSVHSSSENSENRLLFSPYPCSPIKHHRYFTRSSVAKYKQALLEQQKMIEKHQLANEEAETTKSSTSESDTMETMQLEENENCHNASVGQFVDKSGVESVALRSENESEEKRAVLAEKNALKLTNFLEVEESPVFNGSSILDLSDLETEECQESFMLMRQVQVSPYPDLPFEKNSYALPPKHDDKLTLVLDLDETLVHCSTEQQRLPSYDLNFNVVFQGIDFNVFVQKRPHLLEFLKKVSEIFEVVIFTASQKLYADKLLDLLDPSRKFTKHRRFRDACVPVQGTFVKDLRVLGRDLSRVIIVDNAVEAFSFQLENGIPIKSWFAEPEDTELVKLYHFLVTLQSSKDIRPKLLDAFEMDRRFSHAIASQNIEDSVEESNQGFYFAEP